MAGPPRMLLGFCGPPPRVRDPEGAGRRPGEHNPSAGALHPSRHVRPRGLPEVCRHCGEVRERLFPSGVGATGAQDLRRVEQAPEQVDAPPLGHRRAALGRVGLPNAPSQLRPPVPGAGTAFRAASAPRPALSSRFRLLSTGRVLTGHPVRRPHPLWRRHGVERALFPPR